MSDEKLQKAGDQTDDYEKVVVALARSRSDRRWSLPLRILAGARSPHG
jgi:hypothetical protein